MDPKNSMSFQTAFPPVKEAFEEFAAETGRRLGIEIEPGTYFIANSLPRRGLTLFCLSSLRTVGPMGRRQERQKKSCISC